MAATVVVSGWFVVANPVAAACGCSAGGSSSCSGPGTCWKSSPEPSCPGGQWWCSCSCEDLGGGYVCHSCGGSNEEETCQEKKPGNVKLQNPADNSILTVNYTTLKYKNQGGWGEGCPTKKSNKIQYKEAVGGACSSGSWQNTSANLTGLKWETTYCWRVVRSNGSLSRTSDIWKFTTGSKPEITSSGFVSSTISRCSESQSSSGRLTGGANDANINNPVEYEIEFEYGRGADALRYVDLAFVANDTYQLSQTPEGSNQYRYFDELAPYLHDPSGLASFGVRVANLNTTPTFSSVNSTASPYFSDGVSSGDLSTASGIAQIKNIGSDSVVTQTGANSYRIKLQIEFKQVYTYKPLGVYVSVVGEAEDGSLVSHAATSTQVSSYNPNLVLERMDDWIVDMTPPSVSISDPTFISGDQFQLTWTISDNGNVTEVRSYCYFSEDAVATIEDQTVGGQIILNNTVKSYPEPDYCLVTTPGTNNRTYKVADGELTSNIALEVFARDNSCNETLSPGLIDIPTPWIMTLLNTVSVGGYQNLEIPQTSTQLSDIGLNLQNNDFFASYLNLSGIDTLGTPTSKQSKTQTFDRDYDNQATTPINFGYENWYQFALETVSNDATVVDSTATQLSGSLSAAYGIVDGSTYDVHHTGSLEISSGSVCDIRGIIFVEGDLRIEPDFLKANGNACVFIVQGSTHIGRGGHKSAGLPASATARHDRVEAMLVSNGDFVVEEDPVPSNQVADALHILGIVYANSVQFNRQLGLAQSAVQPSELFEYDPNLVYIFRERLDAVEFSLREY